VPVYTKKNRIDFPRGLSARDARAFCEGRLKYLIGLHFARQYWWGVKGIYCIMFVPKYGADRCCRNKMMKMPFAFLNRVSLDEA